MADNFKCPNCQKEYTPQMLFWTFKYYSHVRQMAMKCECKKKLGLMKTADGSLKLFDATELMKVKPTDKI